MKWQRSRCLVVSRLSGDLFTFKFSELDDVTSEGACREGGRLRGREGMPQQVGDFCIRVVAMRRKRQSTEKVSPRLAASSSSFFVAL